MARKPSKSEAPPRIESEESAPPGPLTTGLAGAARLLNLSEPYVATLSDKGVLPCTRDHARRRIFQTADVIALANKRHREAQEHEAERRRDLKRQPPR